MSTKIEIKTSEHGVVRVFDVDLPADQIADLDLKDALGAEDLDTEQAELFDISDLSGMGLSNYLDEGHGIPEDQLKEMARQLDDLMGPVLVLPTRAMNGTAQILTPRAPLHLVATLTEETQPVQFEKLPSDAAQNTPDNQTKPAPSKSAIQGRVASVVLVVLALLVAVMIWIA